MADDDFLAQIELFLRVTGKSPAAFGQEAVGDTNLVSDMRRVGRELRKATRQRVVNYMANYSVGVQQAVSCGLNPGDRSERADDESRAQNTEPNLCLKPPLMSEGLAEISTQPEGRAA